MIPNVDLARLLGQREAFSVVAGRCSAAHAAILLKIHDEKLYLNYAKNWREFCTDSLHMDKATANRIIHSIREFGTTYFEVAELTGISAATYRAIAPFIRDQALHHNGDAITLIPENAQKLSAAIADLRKAAAPVPPPKDTIPQLEKDCTEIVRRIEALIERREWDQPLRAVICSLYDRLRYLELTL
jgi:hypothetical protein